MTKTLQFLARLGADAALRARYGAEPDRVMAEHGLNESERAALNGADSANVRKAAGVPELAPPPKIITAPASVLAIGA